MNCVATSKLVASGLFSDVYLPPDPGDGGTSIGTALFVNATERPSRHSSFAYLPDLGFADDEREILDVVDRLDAKKLMPFRSRGASREAYTIRRQSFATTSEANERVAKLLAEGRIVGYARGKYEFGPRALGHRSILIRPDQAEIALRLSRQVKHRALYRPYALSVVERNAETLLELPGGGRLYRWMQHSARVRDSVRPRVQAAVHVDGTTRPQIVYEKESPAFHELLLGFERETGVPALLNTSFNASGYPLVRTSVDALAMFVRTDMDALLMNNTLIWKERA